jgi:superoxide dismutase
LNLWKDDIEAYNNRVLVKHLSREVFKIKYDKRKANYINKSFFDFKPNRGLKLRLKECIKSNNINAYE